MSVIRDIFQYCVIHLGVSGVQLHKEDSEISFLSIFNCVYMHVQVYMSELDIHTGLYQKKKSPSLAICFK